MMKILIVALFLAIGPVSIKAQFHYEGLEGLSIEYGVDNQYGDLYGINYSRIISQKVQLEFSGNLELGPHISHGTQGYYDYTAFNDIEKYTVNENLNYSLLRLCKVIYINVGVGISQSYEKGKVDAINFWVENSRFKTAEEQHEFDINLVTLPNRLLWGANVQGLLEIYLGRHLTLLARYRYTYFTRSGFDRDYLTKTAGLRLNF